MTGGLGIRVEGGSGSGSRSGVRAPVGAGRNRVPYLRFQGMQAFGKEHAVENPVVPPQILCLQCGRDVAQDSGRVETRDGSFCSACFAALTQDLKRAVAHQGSDINYPAALLGGVLGGAAGAVVWWGFTVLTRIAFGLVAVVIGFAVGWGVTRFSGGKRSRGLQVLSAGIAGVAFFYSQYLVNRTFLQRAYAERGEALSLGWVPEPSLLFQVVRMNFGIFDFVFLAIVLFQAWKIPAPFRIAGLAPAGSPSR